MSTLKEKLDRNSAGQTSDWMKKAAFRRDNQAWLKKSAAIAIKVLSALKAQGLTQKQLAEKLDVSPQQVNKIVQGQENLTLETITKLEVALGILIIEDGPAPAKESGRKKKPLGSS